ncbi:MAG: YifB family Mg chelatase-like AAA ATPase [Clostridia bacterium]|nr:YifB family Mg chelatase-like AAA ATPase [Clostridia bacterium]
MLARIISYGLIGISAFKVDVEVDISNGMPVFEIVGLPDAAVKESRERVRSALRNSGLRFFNQRTTINLAPGDVRKEGTLYDLSIAVGLLAATGQIDPEFASSFVIFGELSLNGGIRPVSGTLPMVMEAKKQGFTRILLPAENAEEAAYLDGLEVYPAKTLFEVHQFLSHYTEIKPMERLTWAFSANAEAGAVDFSLIKGQEGAKRALEIAAAGGHNILLIGPPGTGKTMLARATNGILPDLTFEEALEITKIHSVAGNTREIERGIVRNRPFRAPHLSASTAALAGGGTRANPGEISLAHNGVLFLDELPEFRQDSLEALRQPLEDGIVTISRANATVTYPANFMLIAAMNPCPCGHYGTGECHCTPPQISRYLGRISGPFLDRMDMQVEIGPITYDQLTDESSAEDSNSIRARVNAARAIQKERFKNEPIHCNAEMDTRLLRKHCKTDSRGDMILRQAYNAMGLSARGNSRILKVARSIADLDGSESIKAQHIAEAVQYRSLDRKYWR